VKPTVVLLHGLARSRVSLSGLRRFLEREGYPTFCPSYGSRRQSIGEAAREVTSAILRDLSGRELCAVTHSLGGILVRHMHDPRLDWRRIVMLAPPNRGSRVAQAFRNHPLVRWFYGPAAQELADPAGWPPPPAPFAIIAGTRSGALSNPIAWVTRGLGLFAQGAANDGTLSVEETQLEGMAEFATVDATHTWIMNHPAARAKVLAFLQAS
jgi:hypothetical protein